MKKDNNILLWGKNIALICAVAAVCWLGAKVVRIFMMFNTGGAQVLGASEWEKLKSITAIDKAMIIVLMISVIVVIIVNKIRWKEK